MRFGVGGAKRVIVAAVAVGFAYPALAAAGPATHWRLTLTKTGQKAAMAAVVHQSDLGSGWKGSGAKPNFALPACASRRPNASPLDAIGAAKIDWTNGSLVIKSQAVVLRTAQMVRQDWKRTVVARGILACTRKQAAKSLPRSEQLVSFGWARFPHVTKYAREVRAIVSFHKQLQFAVDFLVVGSGRDEITLTVVAPSNTARSLTRLEALLARKLIARSK